MSAIHTAAREGRNPTIPAATSPPVHAVARATIGRSFSTRLAAATLLLPLILLVLLVGAAESPAAAPDATACDRSAVTFGGVHASGCFKQAGDRQWESKGATTVNGLALTPAAGSTLKLKESTATTPGSLEVRLNAPIEKAGIRWTGSSIRWAFAAGTSGDEQKVATFTARNQRLFGLELSASTSLSLGTDKASGTGYLKLSGHLQLPNIFRSGPRNNAGGLTGDVAIRLDHKGVHLDAVKVSVADAYIGALHVKNLCLAYLPAGYNNPVPCATGPTDESEWKCPANASGAGLWAGGATIVLPTLTRPELSVFAGVRGGALSYAGGALSGLGTALPIAEGVFLDGFGLALCVGPPVKVKGHATINIGTAGVAQLTGGLEYVNSRPWTLKASGKLRLMGSELLKGSLSYSSNDTIRLAMKANYKLGPASLSGVVDGWIRGKPFAFNVDGHGQVCIKTDACATGEIMVSSRGAAGCFTLTKFTYPAFKADWSKWWPALSAKKVTKHIRTGVGYTWADKRYTLLGSACDMSPYKAAMPKSRATVASDDSKTVVVGEREAALSLTVEGVRTAPLVKVSRRGGPTYVQPADGTVMNRNEGVVFVADYVKKSTIVQIANPQAGEWTVQTQNGAPDIAAISRATAQPPPTVIATVVPDPDWAGRPAAQFHKVLRYVYQPQSGHTLAFVEHGVDYEQYLGASPTEGACPDVPPEIKPVPQCGTIPFTVDTHSAPGRRDIFAVMTQTDGETSDEFRVTSYNAEGEPPPPAVSTGSVSRTAAPGLSVRWQAADAPLDESDPVQYNVVAKLSDGRELLAVESARNQTLEVTFPDVTNATAARIEIRSVKADEVEGIHKSVTLPANTQTIAFK